MVTYRRSWSNFLKRFGLVSVGEIEPSPGIPPTKRHTRELVYRMKNQHVQVILVEPCFELKTPTSIVRETRGEGCAYTTIAWRRQSRHRLLQAL